jgi:hypothetical protein
MRNLPYLGKPAEMWESWLCGYSETPADLACHRDATWHGLVLDDPVQRVTAMMASCEEHLPLMKLTADYVHSLKHPCCIPGSRFRWPENECYTEWDSELPGVPILVNAGAS